MGKKKFKIIYFGKQIGLKHLLNRKIKPTKIINWKGNEQGMKLAKMNIR